MISGSASNRRVVLCGLAALTGFGSVMWLDWPGLLSTDSLHQFEQALGGSFSDSHPPAMAWLWSCLLKLVPGPVGMLAVQNALFWAGDALLWAELGPARLAWVGVLGSGLYPPIFALLGIVWKDVQMSCAMLSAAALLLLILRKRFGRWWLAPALFLLQYAAAVRFNGILAVVPLLWLWMRAGFELPGRKRAIATALLSLFLLGFAWVFNRALTDTEDHLSQQYEVHDLVALSLDQDASLLPPAYWAGSRPLSLEEMGAIYDPIEPSFLFWPAQPMAHFDLVTNPKGMPRPASLSALHSAWWRGLVRFPTVILRRRWFLFTEMFGLRREYGCYDYVTQMKPNALGIRLGNPAMHDAASAALEVFRHGWLYRSWIYLALLAGCVVAAVRSGDGGLRAAVVAVAFSGLGSVVAYPLIGSGCDFRYLWWLMITSLLCLLLVMTGRRASDAGS